MSNVRSGNLLLIISIPSLKVKACLSVCILKPISKNSSTDTSQPVRALTNPAKGYFWKKMKEKPKEKVEEKKEEKQQPKEETKAEPKKETKKLDKSK